MKGLVGGPLLVGGLGPGPLLNPALKPIMQYHPLLPQNVSVPKNPSYNRPFSSPRLTPVTTSSGLYWFFICSFYSLFLSVPGSVQ